jgi:flavin-binding protein dodecin
MARAKRARENRARFALRLLRGPAAPHPFDADAMMLGSTPAGASCCLPASYRTEDVMTESVYKVIELIGTSKESWEKAAAAAVTRAAKTLRDLRVAEVVKLDMQLDETGAIEAYRAKLNVSFKFEGS